MHNNNNEFPQGVALVVGGSGGVGAAVCHRLAEQGATVALTYNKNREKALEVAASLAEAGGHAEAFQLNMGDRESAGNLFASLSEQYGNIHTVVLATGYDIPQQYISEITPELWQDIIQSDVNGFFNIAHTAIPYLREEGGGSLVHVSSAGLFRYPARDALSVAPKAAIESLIKGIAKEEGVYGVRANSVAIGVIETGIFLRLKGKAFDKAWEESVLQNLCLKRFGQAEEVADAISFLASSRARYITGQIICVDGGYHV
ncbi:SDR family NAD(P)-dependent oxidoreductase [Endozoicomonas sp.]|uniref:SDR family NAD(P)-dependent oxidoreductase n=1 Tax=Endozoicomonas sp. TaxID=1892382 RepID=UPI00383B9838